jgi:hypothetical protein
MSGSKESPANRPLRAARLVGLAEYVLRRNDKSGDIFPADEPFGTVDGPDPLRVVVLGEANAVGLGVTRHELGMAGHLARLLAARTERGVEWSAIGRPGLRIHDAWEIIGDNHEAIANADVIALMIGIGDTLSLTTRSTWTVHMTDTLDLLTEVAPKTARILVIRIPPMDNAGSVSKLARFAAGRQARLFNRITDGIVSNTRRCETVLFPASLTSSLWVPEGRQSPYVGMYSAWAASAAAVYAGVGAGVSSAPTSAPAPAPFPVAPVASAEPVPPVPTL